MSKKDSDNEMDNPTVYVDALQKVPDMSETQKDIETSEQLAAENRGDPSLKGTLSALTVPQPPANAETSADLLSLTMQECGICMMVVENEMFEHSCRHKFCTSCWQSYLTHSIMSEGRGHNSY